MALAMALTRVIFSLRNMSLITLALQNEEEPKAKRVASRVKVLLASSPQLQYVSTARGTHFQPSSAHLGSLAVCFLFSAASAAAPTLLLASAKIAGVRGDYILKLLLFVNYMNFSNTLKVN